MIDEITLIPNVGFITTEIDMKTDDEISEFYAFANIQSFKYRRYKGKTKGFYSVKIKNTIASLEFEFDKFPDFKAFYFKFLNHKHHQPKTTY